MSGVKRIPRRNRLKEIVSRPGGLTVGQALKGAEEQLQALHGEGVLFIDQQLDRICELAAALTDPPAEPALEEIYRISDQVHGLAGTFGLGHVGRAAHSLCDLLDRQLTSDRPNAVAVAVHVDSLRLLRSGAPDAAERERMLEGLGRVVERA